MPYGLFDWLPFLPLSPFPQLVVARKMVLLMALRAHAPGETSNGILEVVISTTPISHSISPKVT